MSEDNKAISTTTVAPFETYNRSRKLGGRVRDKEFKACAPHQYILVDKVADTWRCHRCHRLLGQ